ncbi:MAG: extracellular solute-binding protein [Halanaerobiaceae bacterium]|nr:extracellular solute-binding protein [Halanaerobiaceae bacterium]
MKTCFRVVLSVLLVFLMSFSAGATKLVVWQSSGPQEDFINLMGKIYEDETGIEIEVQPVDQLSQDDKLALDGPAGKGPDIMAWPHDQLGIPVMQGLLWEIPEDQVDLGVYSDTAVQAMRVGGKLYGIPYAVETTALVYNKDIISEIPENFDEFLDLVISLNRPEENKYGFLANLEDFYYMHGIIAGYGGYVFDRNEDGSLNPDDIGLANEGAIEAMKLIRSFRTSGLMPEGSTYDVAMGLFTAGDLAVTLTGPWEFDNLNKSGINYGIAPLPKLENGNYPKQYMGVKGYYISNFSENKEEALKFILWLTSKENNYRQHELTAIIPAREDVIDMPEFREDENYRAFAIQAGRGEPMPNIPEMSQVWEPMINALTFVVNGDAAPEEVLPVAVQQIRENIEMMKK